MNRKFLIYIVIAIISGGILGNLFYRNYIEEKDLNNEYNSYLLQLGVYDSIDEMNSNIKDLSNYLVIEKNNKHYVYVGISSKKDNAKKIKDAFLEEDINVSIKKTVIDNIEFMSNLEQFDILLDSASSNRDIMSINEVIMSSYEEMVLSE